MEIIRTEVWLANLLVGFWVAIVPSISHALVTKGKGFSYTAMSHSVGESTKRTRSKPIKMYWSNQSKWLVESIEMIGLINRNDWLNQSNLIKFNRSDWLDYRTQSNPIEDLHFFQLLLISIVYRSIQLFDWSLRLSLIDLTNQFDRVRLSLIDSMTSPGLWKSLRVLPHIDNCSQLWSPSKISDPTTGITSKVLPDSLNRIPTLQYLNYWEKLKELKLYSLERQRERYRIIYTWNILDWTACPVLNFNYAENKRWHLQLS